MEKFMLILAAVLAGASMYILGTAHSAPAKSQVPPTPISTPSPPPTDMVMWTDTNHATPSPDSDSVAEDEGDEPTRYRTYANTRAGFRTCYPMGMSITGLLYNDTMRVLEDANRTAKMVIWTEDNPYGETIAQHTSHPVGDAETVMSESVVGNWKMQFGKTPDSYFWRKIFITKDGFITFDLRYRIADASEYAPIADAVDRCTVVGRVAS